MSDVEFADIHEVAGDGGSCGHEGADEMRATVLALAPLEVAVRGGSAALVRRQHVGVHADAHAAARITPFEAGLAENFVEAFLFSGALDPTGTGNNESLFYRARNVLAGNQMYCRAQIVQP